MLNLINKEKKIQDMETVLNKNNISSSDDWNELCEKCSSLVSKANLSSDDIDSIVAKVKEELH